MINFVGGDCDVMSNVYYVSDGVYGSFRRLLVEPDGIEPILLNVCTSVTNIHVGYPAKTRFSTTTFLVFFVCILVVW